MSDLSLRIIIRAVTDQFTAAVNGVRSQLNQLGHTELNRLQQSINRTEQGLFGLGRALDGVKGMIASAFAITGIAAFTKGLADAVQKAQDLRLRLSGLTHGQADYAASEAYLVDLAGRHHKSLSMLTESYTAFLALEQSGIINRQQAMQLLEGFSNAGSKVGATATQIGQSVYGLAQALGTGIVAMEEFKQITEPMPGLANELAKAYGMTVGELRKLIGTGTVASEDFGKKFVIALQAYEGATERAGGTISASYADIENAYIAMAKELEKPISSGILSLVDSGKAAYGWIKDNGTAIVSLLSLIAVTLTGKVVGSLASYAAAKATVIAVEAAHRAALIEQAERNLAVIASQNALSASTLATAQATVNAAQTSLAAAVTMTGRMAATNALNIATVALTAAEAADIATTVARTTAMVALIETDIAATRALLAGTLSMGDRAAITARLTTQTAQLATATAAQTRAVAAQTTATEAQTLATSALTAANNTAGVAMTRLAAAGKAAFAFIGGWVGVAVIALYGLYVALEKVTGAEEKAELKAKAMADALALSASEVKKLSALEVDIDFKKTEKSIDDLKARLKELEAFSLGKLFNLGDLSAQRDNLLQELAVLEARKPELVTQKQEQIKNFDPVGLSVDDLKKELEDTRNVIDGINDALSRAQSFEVKTALNLDLNAYQSKLAALEGMINEVSRAGKPNQKFDDANAKAEQKIVESSFKLKEQLAKNAYDTALALAGDDSAKRLQLDKAYNEDSLKLTLARLDAQAAALEAVNAQPTKKTKDPELKAQLASIEDQKQLAQSDAVTKSIQLGADAQKTASDDVLSVQLANLKTQQDALKNANEYDLKQVDNTYADKELALKQQYNSELITKQQMDAQLLDMERSKAAEELDIKRKLTAQTTRLELDAINAKIQAAQTSGGGNYDGLISAATQKYGLPDGLVRAVMQTESRGNPNAVSEAGAAGLMQIMPGTAKGLGVTDRFDPQQSIEGGAKLLRQLLDDFNGDIKLALAAYNAKPSTVKKYQAGQGDLPGETKAYIPKVLNEIQNPTGGASSSDNVKLKALYAEREAVQAEALAASKSLGQEGQANALEQSAAELEIKKAALDQQKQLDEENTAAASEAALAEINAKADASEQELALGNITQEQHLANLRDFAVQRLAIELDLLDAKRRLMDNDALALAQNLHEKEALVRGYVATQKGIDNKEATDKQAAFKKMFQPFETAMDGMVQGVLTGQQTPSAKPSNMPPRPL